ncbi:hypothetical protein Lal_00019025 [Lupinus albus]|uniref:Uncharacterized protein n=1 Tax=Lupinus albus TaxID=3870 RepID=A0A6A4R185_LUPAL|nr:hypothetical protein Lalb_Chr01g0003711 [Lupinus albus]KAF1898904.1 hypothetical protein Lal_00019025 [Lupinus albus]
MFLNIVLGIGFTTVLGCILLGLIVGLRYLLWWKKTRTCIGIKIGEKNNVKGMLYGACGKTQSTINPRSVSVATNQENISSSVEPDLELGVKVSNDMVLKTLEEEGLDLELMSLYNLAGPPRFLFTIKEETREDLESEDKSRKGSSRISLTDIIVANNTPVTCSPLKCSLDNIDSYKHHGFNPLFESSLDSDFNRFRTSPQKNLDPLPEAEVKDSSRVTEERDKSLLMFMNNKEKEMRELQQHLPKFPSSKVQVLPFASSPITTFRSF